MTWLSNTDVVFKKTGADIKGVVRSRIADLQKRLTKRNAQLDKVMEDKALLRSYLVREPANDWPQSNQLRQEAPTEEHQEITELCRRINLIEKDLHMLRMIITHLRDDQEFDLAFDDMVKYGFPVE